MEELKESKGKAELISHVDTWRCGGAGLARAVIGMASLFQPQ
jgi:hypothetical protein